MYVPRKHPHPSLGEGTGEGNGGLSAADEDDASSRRCIGRGHPTAWEREKVGLALFTGLKFLSNFSLNKMKTNAVKK